MDTVRECVLTLTAAALVCAIAMALVPQGQEKTLVRICCGLVMTLVMLGPISRLDLQELLEQAIPTGTMWQDAVMEGKTMADNAAAEIIKAKSEAYILDKAAAMGADIQAEVTLSRDGCPVPVQVKLRGAIAPAARQQLQDRIAVDLGIPKEAQSWIS